jgi:hypothetical protein
LFAGEGKPYRKRHPDMESSSAKDSENSKKDGMDLSTVQTAIADKQTKLLSIPAVVVRNENNDIIEQMDKPNMDFSKTVRRNLKSKLIQRANSPVKEQIDKIQDTLSENSESGSEEGLSDSSDAERDAVTEKGNMGGGNVVTTVGKEVGSQLSTARKDCRPVEEEGEEADSDGISKDVEIEEKSNEAQTKVKGLKTKVNQNQDKDFVSSGTKTERRSTKESEKDFAAIKNTTGKDYIEEENRGEQDIKTVKNNVVENEDLAENEKLVGEKNESVAKHLEKSSDQASGTEIDPTRKEIESKKNTGSLNEEDIEADDFNEKDFCQFNITQPCTKVAHTNTTITTPPPLMIPALGVAVNPASIPVIGQFPQGAADLDAVAMQQFQQFNVQPTVANSSAPVNQVMYSSTVKTVLPAGMGIQTPHNRFPVTNQTINVIHGAQLPQISHRFITGVPLGIVPLVPNTTITPMVHHQMPIVPQPASQATQITTLPTPIQTAVPKETMQTAVVSQFASQVTSQLDKTIHAPQFPATGVSVLSSSNQMHVNTITMQPLANSLAAQHLVSSSATPTALHSEVTTQVKHVSAPKHPSASQSQVKHVSAPKHPSAQQSQVTTSPQSQPTQGKPDSSPVQQKADASTYVNADFLVDKVKMVYFQCDKCTFVTKSAQNFRRHYMLHLNYRPYVCSNCGFPSCNKYGFSSHLKNHQECAGQHFVYKKDVEAERELERNVNVCKHYKWVSDEENDKSSKELFGDQRRFRFTAKKSEPASSVIQYGTSGESTEGLAPDVQLGVVQKTYSGKKKIRDILGEIENKTKMQGKSLHQSGHQDDNPNQKIDSGESKTAVDVVDNKNDNSFSKHGGLSFSDGSQEKEDDSDEMSDIIEQLPPGKTHSITSEKGNTSKKYSKSLDRIHQKKQNGKIKTSSFLNKNFKKAKRFIFGKKKRKFARRRRQDNKVQNYEIVDESNILDLPRVRKFKTTFDPSPDHYRRRKKEMFMEAEHQKPTIPPKPEIKESTASSYKCPYCDHTGESAIGIRRHAFWVHNMCEYTCNLCLYMSMSKQECLKHCYTDHPGTSPCIKRSFCKAMDVEETVDDRDSQKDQEVEKDQTNDQKNGSDTGTSEEEVEESQHPAKSLVKGMQDTRCVECNLRFTRKGMQLHLLRKHNVFMMKCPYCKFMSKTKEKIKGHCSSVHNQKTAKVVHATYDLSLGHDLVEFLSNKSTKEMKEKKEKYSSKLTLKKTMKRPLNATCPLCKFASSYIGVQRHLSMRHKLRNLQCGRCGLVMYNKSDAVKHSKKNHKETTPYVLRSFADIESVKAMSKDELKKCGAVLFDEEKQNIDTEEENLDLKPKTPLKDPKGPSPSKKGTKDGWVSCPICFAEKRTMRGVELHMMYVHKICNWFCGRCGFESTDKYVTLQHSVDLHKGEDPIISRASVNLEKYLAEMNVDVNCKSSDVNYLGAKLENTARPDPYKLDVNDVDDGNQSAKDSLKDKKTTLPDENETSHDTNVVESSSSKKTWKRRSCSPKASDFSGTALPSLDKWPQKRNLKDLTNFSGASVGDSQESDSTEDSYVIKKKRKKKSPLVARSSPSLCEYHFYLLLLLHRYLKFYIFVIEVTLK